ncbi:hypothetical protein CVM73_19745 [Bradyrhizobium forestalis]|uniref:Acetyl-coenzyme A synthetase N-terminal domain-containing protein n=1 Tax=Bradyrhizobium forestalis TaxID=1419263 RepID=A0A2M8R7A0_9BRAD|nr:hypothetical protein CVM73_19745 [Bradyrhizobium forestalis]
MSKPSIIGGLGVSHYQESLARALADPEGLWAEAAKEVDWIEWPRKIFDPSMGIYGRWCAGGAVNTCYNTLDRHVAHGSCAAAGSRGSSPRSSSAASMGASCNAARDER